jgi:pentatricopeptide repeat protein
MRRENPSLLQKDVVIACMLVGIYGSHGLLGAARDVLENLTLRDVVVWTTFMEALDRHGFGADALACFDRLQIEGLSPDSVTLICVLKACVNSGDAEKGQSMHGETVKKGFDEDIAVCTSLVDMYVKCGIFISAKQVFYRIPMRNTICWNALMAGYIEHGYGEETLVGFWCMQEEGLAPDDATYICVLKACSITKNMKIGQRVHSDIVGKGFEEGIFVHNTLIDMYAKCGFLTEAEGVFGNLIVVRDEISWNALLSGYVEHGHNMQALDLFEEMRRNGFSNPHLLMFVCGMKACTNLGAIKRGQILHLEITKKGLGEDALVCNTLIDMYASSSLLMEAQHVFDNLLVKTLVSWNSLIAGYVENGQGETALDLFYHMVMVADATTFVCTLKACGNDSALYKGQEIHIQLVKQGIEKDVFVCNTLVDTYAKCGSLAEAQGVYERLSGRDMITWNALITGYAQIGDYGAVFAMVVGILEEGNAKLDSLAFVILLNACCHAGVLIDEGIMWFGVMRERCGIVPTLEHNSCMVNLLSRAGHIEEAVKFIEVMPCHPGAVVWNTMIGACRKWGSYETGLEILQHTIQLNANEDAAYFGAR